jgi:hypothetical protein
MLVTLSYNDLQDVIVTLTTEHNDPQQETGVIFKVKPPEAEKLILAKLKQEEEGLYGHYGHLINFNRVTNLDLQAAMRNLKAFTLISINPEMKADPNFPPKGAVS